MRESTIETLSKDFGEIHARLLDHKPVIQGEIKFFAKEFEGKRGDSEYKRLEKIETQMKDLNEKTIPECNRLMETHLPLILQQLDIANKFIARIQRQEEFKQETKPLGEQREHRDKEWTAFLERLTKQRDQLEEEHQQRMKDLDEHYTKLKDNLIAKK
ncbi:biogenesis of lysosome-related organelles complex 1 subunit 5-like [Amphiura filiformis]|uniref:biogenesis of lysosome-related organelles complex 1 subunit 5-like n=1 Tax=Amphiura filiformis TaxID=82378 RepID=UPI003B211CF0